VLSFLVNLITSIPSKSTSGFVEIIFLNRISEDSKNATAVTWFDAIVTPVFAVAVFDVPFAVSTAPLVVGDIELNPEP
jgi:hypothetical protein